MRSALSLALVFLVSALSTEAADSTARVVVKDGKGQPVSLAVVTFTPLDRPLPPAPEPGRVEVAQEDEQYQPYLTIVRTGTTVEFPNKDRIQHHLYSVSAAKKFEKPLYAPGARESMLFDRPGIVTLGCNIHDWMVAYVVVVDTPWFARSNDAGAAEAILPAGRYRLEVWHPRLIDPKTRRPTGAVQQEITLAEGESAHEVALPLAPERRMRRAPTGKSNRY